MEGRYGTDKLNMAILGVGLIFCVLAMFARFALLDLIFTGLSYLFMAWAIFRMLSRNTYKRYRENRNYLNFLQRVKDRQHRYYECPRCRQTVRVPRGKGKIVITCPKCRQQIHGKS